jgi:hypothetical protein
MRPIFCGLTGQRRVREGLVLLYELTFLTIRPNQLGPVLAALPEAVPAAAPNGELIGCLSCDLGSLNRIAIVTAYEDPQALLSDRAAALSNPDPYGVSTYLSASFKPLSFMTKIVPGAHGPFYEMRTYEIAPKGMPETEAAWGRVVEQRCKLSPLLMVMASLDTLPTRMVHLWPYKSLDERLKLRGEASKQGIWPPPGGSNHVLSLRSEIFMPLAFSPLK